MAQYQVPPDPRESELKPKRPRRQRHDGREQFPWLWFGLGIVVTIIGIGLATTIVSVLLARQPLATTLATPTILRLTAPPSPQPSATTVRPTPTSIPTLTPVPTRDLSSPPDEITVGYYAVVSGTGDLGLTIRGGPSTGNVRIMRAPEGTQMLVIGGPEASGEFTWWQVRLLDGTEGWAAGRFLEMIPAPEETPEPES